MKFLFKNLIKTKQNGRKERIYIIVLPIIILGFILLIFLSLKLFNTKNSSRIANKPASSHVDKKTSFQNIRRILDNSLVKQNATYLTHQEIQSPNKVFDTYSFIYWKDNESTSIPTFEELSSSIKKSKQLKILGQEIMNKALKTHDNELAQQAASMLIEADKLLTQENSFFTIEIAKDSNMPPILMFHHGLPEWIILREKAMELAKQQFGEPGRIANVERTVIGAPFIYVITNSKGDSIFIDARNEHIFLSRTKPPFKPQIRNSKNTNENHRLRIQNQWNEFLQNGVDLEGFSLDSLKDLSKQKK